MRDRLLARAKRFADVCADAGIAWNSAGIDWPEKSPILSQKDADLPSLSAYQSPFRFEA